MTAQEKIDALKEMLANGTFDHATYRDRGTLWEGLHIYTKNAEGFRGYEHSMIFHAGTPELKEAEALTRGTGVSVGAYGEG